ncbi:MAG: AAA family ATPase [Nitrospiraceae bacterium]|nr:AAA family ATPase [Nitrospiraceae bacterium]
MSVKIKTIDIHAFRGIPDFELQLDGKNLLLRGENGTGKSSLVEAIEFFFTGKISHLEGTKGLSLQRHGPHVNFKPGDLNVELTFNPGDVALNRSFAVSPSPPEQFEDYFQITQSGTFIMRRSQILTFIMSKPAERFRAIGSIIGVESLDEIEIEMMRVRDDLKGEVKSKEAKIGGLISDLSTIIEKDITKVEEVLPALNEVLQESDLPIIKSLEDVDKHAEEMLKAVKKTETIDKIEVLNKILRTTKTELVAKEIIDELNDLNNKVKHLLQEDSRSELSVANLLESGRKVIEEEEMDICPLCEQKIDRERLLVTIDERLKTLRNLSDKASEVRTMSIPVINKLNGIVDEFKTTIPKIELFPELAEEKSKIIEKIAFLNEFVSHIASAKDLKNEIKVQEFDQQKNEINEIWSSLSTKCGQLLNAIGLTEDEKKVLGVARLIEQARSKATELSKAQAELTIYQNRFGLAEKIFSTFSETKKAKIQEIYNAIQGNIQGFYSMLHPNEPHKNIELVVALGRRASTELRMESFGREGEDPRALTSEGHLDSLGLCIFLGFVKKFNEGCSLIVLDDVVSTVDAKHRENICKLLLGEFRDKQLIITTHDGVWYEQLRAFQRAYGIEGYFKNLVITNWHVESGPTIRPYKIRWERIQEKLDSGDKPGAGNEGRQYLEWLLKHICEVTNTPVPVNNWQGGMVSGILPHAKKRCEDLIKEDEFRAKISKSFQDLETTIIMGNLLSHNNMLAEDVSIEEVKRFCESVHNLRNVFLCPTCGNFVGYYPKLKRIRCSNPRCGNPVEVKTK